MKKKRIPLKKKKERKCWVPVNRLNFSMTGHHLLICPRLLSVKKEFEMKHLKTKVLPAEVQTHLGNTKNVPIF